MRKDKKSTSEQLKNGIKLFEIIELEDRLEMVQLYSTVASKLLDGPGCCGAPTWSENSSSITPIDAGGAIGQLP